MNCSSDRPSRFTGISINDRMWGGESFSGLDAVVRESRAPGVEWQPAGERSISGVVQVPDGWRCAGPPESFCDGVLGGERGVSCYARCPVVGEDPLLLHGSIEGCIVRRVTVFSLASSIGDYNEGQADFISWNG